MSFEKFTVTLEACRVNAHKTQKEWGESIGVTNTTVCNWENGTTEPSLSQLRIISNLSGIPMDFISVH